LLLRNVLTSTRRGRHRRLGKREYGAARLSWDCFLSHENDACGLRVHTHVL